MNSTFLFLFFPLRKEKISSLNLLYRKKCRDLSVQIYQHSSEQEFHYVACHLFQINVLMMSCVFPSRICEGWEELALFRGIHSVTLQWSPKGTLPFQRPQRGLFPHNEHLSTNSTKHRGMCVHRTHTIEVMWQICQKPSLLSGCMYNLHP